MSAILFDRDKVEHLGDLSDRPGRLSGSKLLWVDLHDGSEFSADEVAEELGLDDETRRCLATPNEKACFNDYGRYIHITTYAPREDDEGELHALECVVGQNWVVTAHDRPIPVLDEFADRVSGLRRHRLPRRPELPRCAARMGARRLHRARSSESSSGWRTST